MRQPCRRTQILCVLSLMLTVALCSGSLCAQQPGATKEGASEKTEETFDFWMKKKLDYSQRILAGLTKGDLDAVADAARSMNRVSKLEGFIHGRTPEYRSQLQLFENATEEILRQADRDNVDGAALAFTQLTVSCVRCHQRLRDGK